MLSNPRLTSWHYSQLEIGLESEKYSFMEQKISRKNPKVHVTGSASDTVFDTCEFIGVDLQNDGKGTRILKTKFSMFTDFLIREWHTTWWGTLVLTIISGLFVGITLYFLGISKNDQPPQQINGSIVTNNQSGWNNNFYISPQKFSTTTTIEIWRKNGKLATINVDNAGTLTATPVTASSTGIILYANTVTHLGDLPVNSAWLGTPYLFNDFNTPSEQIVFGDRKFLITLTNISPDGQNFTFLIKEE